MKNYIFPAFLLFAVLVLFGGVASGQKKASELRSQSKAQAKSDTTKNGAITQVANFAGQVTVVIVKSAAKTAWVTTKFAAKDVAKPILFKLLPVVTKYSFKFSGFAVKRLLPHAAKLALL